MSSRQFDAVEAVRARLAAALGPDWGLEDFPADPLTRSDDEVPEHEPGQLRVTRTVQLSLPLVQDQELAQRARSAEVPVDELASEWVAAEADQHRRSA